MVHEALVNPAEGLGKRFMQIQRGFTIKRKPRDRPIGEIERETNTPSRRIELCGRHPPARVEVNRGEAHVATGLHTYRGLAMKTITRTELEALIEANAQALTLIVGLLAEAAGTIQTAYQLAAAMEAAAKTRPNPLRDRLLFEALQLVVLKARNRHPDDPVLRDLAASVLPTQTKQ